MAEVAKREAPALIGVAEPVVLTVDNGGTNTRVAHSVADGEMSLPVAYATPAAYDQAIGKIAATAKSILGVSDRTL